jgi:hypothetical protein
MSRRPRRRPDGAAAPRRRPGGPAAPRRRPRTHAGRLAALLLAAACAPAAVPAAAGAAIPNDGPAGAVPFLPADAENGPVTDLQRTVSLDGAGPDADAPRCLGPTSFERTAWLSVPAAGTPRRLSIEAAAKDGSTATPDLAAYVQAGAGGTDVREPQACSGRETAGDPARGDTGAAVVLVVPAGRTVLVQVAWRGADDPKVPVVASLTSTPLPAADAPAGQAFASAPFAARGAGLVVALAGAATLHGDPAQPRCATQAGVWRRVTVPRRGVYATAVAGDAASAVTVFGTTPSGDSALACADDAASPALTSVFRARRTGTFWVRVGTDAPVAGARAGLAVLGPYRTAKAGRAAAPAASDRANRALDPGAPCTDRRAPHPAVTAASLRSLRRGGRVLRGTNDGAACVSGRSTVVRFTVAVARVRGGRCAWRTGRSFGRPRSCATPRGARRASGKDTWRVTLPAALPRRARYRIVVRAQVRTKSRVKDAGTRVVLGVTR